MSSARYAIKLLLSLACLALTILVICRGQAGMNAVKAARAAAAQEQQKPTPTPTLEPSKDKTADLLAELQKKQAALDGYEEEVSKKYADTESEIQTKQRKISTGSQLYQILTYMTQQIVAVSGSSNDTKLKDLLVNDVVRAGFQVHTPVGDAAGSPKFVPAPVATPAIPAMPTFSP